METKHTPGPWHYDGYIVTADAGNPNQAVARVTQFLPEFREESAANAALIVSAPDMLAALAGCVKAYEETRDGEPTGHLWPDPNHIFYARAAIAKAQG